MKSLELFFVLFFLGFVNVVGAQDLPILNEQEEKLLQNLPEDIKERVYQQLGSAQPVTNIDTREVVTEDTVLNPILSKNTEEGFKKFGYDFFSGIPTTFTPINDVPVPGDYQIGIGDVLQINFNGQRSGQFNLTVNTNGQVYIPEIGPISALNLTFDEVRANIIQAFEDFYVSVEANVALLELKFVQVTVLGAVKNPGSYLVNPFTSISNLLSFAGGLEEYGSLRNIVLKSKKEKYFDMYDFLINGKSERLNLRSGDVVFVPSTSNFVLINGEVNRPAVYEYKPSDSVEALLGFAQNFTRYADKNNFQIKYYDGAKLESILYTDYKTDINVDSITEIYIPKIVPIIEDDVYILGDVANSGPFSLKKYSNLNSLLEALSFSNNAYPFFAVLENTSDRSSKNQYFPFSLKDPDTHKGLTLKSGSKIYFFKKENFLNDETIKVLPNEIKELIEAHKINLNGEFLNNSRMPIFGKVKISELIDYSGGLTPKADTERLELILPIEQKTIFNPGKNYELLSPIGATINAPKFNSNIINIEINGEVNNPGIYPVLSGTTVGEIYEKAGGLKNTSSADSIILLREDLRKSEVAALEVAKASLLNSLVETITNNAAVNNNISVGADIISLLNQASMITPVGRLSGNLAPGSENAKSLIVKDGDQIIVPQISQTITIFGEVNNQTTLSFSSEYSLGDYIDLAGGLKPSAEKSGIFIIRADGTSAQFDKGLFNSGYILLPGDTIIVPKDLDKISGLPLVKVATDILSSIAFSAASLNAIQN